MKDNRKKLRCTMLILAALLLCLWAAPVYAASAKTEAPVLKGMAQKDTVTLKWNQVKKASGYQLFLYYPGVRKYQCIRKLKAGTDTLTLTGSTDRTYRYKIRAYYQGTKRKFYGPASAELAVKTAPSPSAVSSVERRYGDTAIVKWKKISSADGYHVLRSEKENGPYTKIVVIYGNKVFSYMDTTLDKHKTYYYRVRTYAKNPGTAAYGSHSKSRKTSPRTVMVIGDSRTVMMEAAVGNEDLTWICKSGMGYVWLRDTAVKEAEKRLRPNEDVVVWLGVNDPYNNLGMNNNYAELMNELSRTWKSKGVNVYFMETGPLDHDPYVTAEEIEKYNANMKQRLKGVRYIPLYSWLKKQGYLTTDGIHYDDATSRKVYSYMMSKIR